MKEGDNSSVRHHFPALHWDPFLKTTQLKRLAQGRRMVCARWPVV